MTRNIRLTTALALAGVLQAGALDMLKRPPKVKFFVYVASQGTGIASYLFDSDEAAIESRAVTASPPKPAWLAVHPSNQLLYAISDDTLSSFAVNAKTGVLRAMNTVPSRGSGGCHLVLDKNGWMILATNCATGNVASFRTEGDGGIGQSIGLQATGHARQVVISPDNFFLVVPDSADKLFSYRFNPSEATFWPNAPPVLAMKPGTAPRRIAFRPDERFGYSVDEKSSTISVLRFNREAGVMKEVLESVPAGRGASEITLDSAGKFAYVIDRIDNRILVFSVNGKRGTLTQIQETPSGGAGPKAFRIDPSGRFLFVANETSNTVVLFEIDRKTGILTGTGKVLTTPAPVCVAFIPAE